jgi:hypothetical protein
MEKQQTLRRSRAGASSPCAGPQAQKSLATRPREGAPHRVLERRNQILARADPPSQPSDPGDADAPAPIVEEGRKRLRQP